MYDELQQLQKRIEELAGKSYAQGIYTYTGFLSMGEQDAFYGMLPRLAGTAYELYGGREGCERQMLRFGSKEALGYEEAFPITCLSVSPAAEKFAENVTHRDFLGAVMNLGISRSTVGDILIEGKSAYVFCEDRMADYILENLDRVRHTKVRCSRVDAVEALPVKEPETLCFTVSSQRADGIIAKLYHLSRSQSMALFKEKRIYVNSRLSENNSYVMKSGDMATVRGYGRFVYYGIGRETKKGKWSISVGIYR